MKHTFLASSLSLLLFACGKAPSEGDVSDQTPSDFAAHWVKQDVLLLSPAEGAVSFELVYSEDATLDNGHAPDKVINLQLTEQPDFVSEMTPHMVGFQSLKPEQSVESIEELLKRVSYAYQG